MTTITGKNIKLFNMLALKQAMRLETLGVRSTKGSAYAHIKRVYGLRGNKQSVYTQFCEVVEKEKGNAI
jgi:hypothetical protein